MYRLCAVVHVVQECLSCVQINVLCTYNVQVPKSHMSSLLACLVLGSVELLTRINFVYCVDRIPPIRLLRVQQTHAECQFFTIFSESGFVRRIDAFTLPLSSKFRWDTVLLLLF